MLPTEAFAEAVAFLRLFDMNALVVTNAMCSSLAVKGSARILCEEFPGLAFHTWNQRIHIWRTRSAVNDDGLFHLQSVASLRFASKNETTEFVDAAFANCLFENLAINDYAGKHRMDAIGRVASSVILKGFLLLDGSNNLAESLGLLRRFREVKASRLIQPLSDDEASEIANFLRGSCVQELQYYRGLALAPTTLALF